MSIRHSNRTGAFLLAAGLICSALFSVAVNYEPADHWHFERAVERKAGLERQRLQQRRGGFFVCLRVWLPVRRPGHGPARREFDFNLRFVKGFFLRQ